LGGAAPGAAAPGATGPGTIVADYVDSGLIDLTTVDLGQLAAAGHCSPDSALGRSVARVLALAASRDADLSDFSNSL
jgi:FXSXX-COOH protein